MVNVELKMACFLSIALARTTIFPAGRTVLAEELAWRSVICFRFTTYGTTFSWLNSAKLL